MAIASISGEPGRTLAGEVEAVAGPAHGVDVAAVSAGETRVLLWEAAWGNVQNEKT